MRVEALANGAGYEQSICLNNLKVTIAETTAASAYTGVPERMVTVFKRASGHKSTSDEVVFSKSATLLGVPGHDAARQAQDDDTNRAESLALSSLLDETAQAYGTSPGQLIKAVVSVAPAELGSAVSQVMSV